MLDRLFGAFSKDIGIDLGTANTLVYVKGRGIVINEPSVVSVNKKTGQIIAIGSEAQKMIGKTPAFIVASRPLVSGVVSDFEVTEQMLKYYIDKVHKESFTLVPRPRVVIGIPSGVTEVEKRAVEDAVFNAGAREVYLIEEPMAAAIGARLPIYDPRANLIVDVGGGTTEVALICLGGMVALRSIRVAGDKFNEDIVQYIKDEFRLLIGERMAEEIKISIGSVWPEVEELDMEISGRDAATGLPKEMKLASSEIRKALMRSTRIIINAVKDTIEDTPPELISDLTKKAIYLAGGGSLLRGFDALLAHETKLPVKIIDDPLTAVVRGCGIVLEDVDKLKDILISTDKEEFQ
ncbi:MAG: rod shape-determining protein [Parcubacteria group bacterium]|nr:rod shape-determining protein [Parcubacteria group bacterium]